MWFGLVVLIGCQVERDSSCSLPAFQGYNGGVSRSAAGPAAIDEEGVSSDKRGGG